LIEQKRQKKKTPKTNQEKSWLWFFSWALLIPRSFSPIFSPKHQIPDSPRPQRLREITALALKKEVSRITAKDTFHPPGLTGHALIQFIN